MIKRYLLLTLAVVTLLTVCATPPLYFVLQRRGAEKQESHISIYPLSEARETTFVEATDEGFLLHSANSIGSYNLKSKIYKKLAEIGESEIGGYENGQIYICSYENFVITSPDQFATKITIHGSDRTPLDEIALHETVRPISCSPVSIILTNNYHGAPERYYRYDPQAKKIEIIDKPGVDSLKTEDETQKLILREEEIALNTSSSFVAAFPSKDKRSVALIDSNGNVWIVERR